LESFLACDACGDQIHIAQDAHQQIVEIASGTAFEHAEGFESLSVPQEFFNPLKFGDVLMDAP